MNHAVLVVDVASCFSRRCYCLPVVPQLAETLVRVDVVFAGAASRAVVADLKRRRGNSARPCRTRARHDQRSLGTKALIQFDQERSGRQRARLVDAADDKFIDAARLAAESGAENAVNRNGRPRSSAVDRYGGKNIETDVVP